MKITRILILAAVTILFSHASGHAISLTFNPASQTVAQGGIATVTVRIADLFTINSNTAPSLSAFDFNVNFNPAILSFSSATFGGNLTPLASDQLQLVTPGCSLPSPLGALFCGSTAGVGTVNLFELSDDSVANLNSLQADAFILATLRFNAVAGGTSPLTFSAIILGDALGNPIAATAGTGSIVVQTITNGVPEPSAFLLLGLGLAVLSIRLRGKQAQ